MIMVHKQEGQWCITVINADGSHARNCGNGLRIAARHIARVHRVQGPISIMFAGTRYLCTQNADEIAVAMGLCTIRPVDELLSLPKTVSFAHGHIGNDHLIFLLEDGEEKYYQLLSYVQDKLANAGDFNLGFLWRDKDGQWISRVFERGVGFTKSCGTGAIVAASFLQSLSLVRSPAVTIHQTGGMLKVIAKPVECGPGFASFDIVQQGNAQEVFEGICQIA